jgi:hypothetical protein
MIAGGDSFSYTINLVSIADGDSTDLNKQVMQPQSKYITNRSDMQYAIYLNRLT